METYKTGNVKSIKTVISESQFNQTKIQKNVVFWGFPGACK